MKYNRPRKSRRIPYKKVIHLITEGTKTEPQYFLWFKSDSYVLKYHKKSENATSPKGLVERARAVEKENKLFGADQIWIVSDKDNWTVEHFAILKGWIDNVRHCHALSNPCFERWLLFHFEDVNTGSTEECLSHLRKHIPNYDKNFNAKKLTREMINIAVERAKKQDKCHNGNCFDFSGSTVYKLVELLLKDSAK